LVGFSVRESAHGSLAVTEAAAYRPDLVLLAVRPRTAPGVVFAHILRRATEGACKAIVGLSAGAVKDERWLMAEEGVDGMLSMPFREEDLLEEIRARLHLTYTYEDVPESTLPPPSDGTASDVQLAAHPSGGPSHRRRRGG